MNHTHHSPFLQKLMVYAVTFDGQPPAVLTAERFLYAAFAAADGAVAAETAEEKAERLALTARLSAFGADGDGGHADICPETCRTDRSSRAAERANGVSAQPVSPCRAGGGEGGRRSDHGGQAGRRHPQTAEPGDRGAFCRACPAGIGTGARCADAGDRPAAVRRVSQRRWDMTAVGHPFSAARRKTACRTGCIFAGLTEPLPPSRRALRLFG